MQSLQNIITDILNNSWLTTKHIRWKLAANHIYHITQHTTLKADIQPYTYHTYKVLSYIHEEVAPCFKSRCAAGVGVSSPSLHVGYRVGHTDGVSPVTHPLISRITYIIPYILHKYHSIMTIAHIYLFIRPLIIYTITYAGYRSIYPSQLIYT